MEQAQTRTPVKVYPWSDVESAIFPPAVPKSATRPKHASKCFVFFLVMVVVLSALTLTLALTVFQVEAPEFKLRVASVNNLKYDTNSTSTWVRGTLVGEVKLRNTNFGTFELKNGLVNVSYGNKDFVGGKVIRHDCIRAQETETMMASVDFMIKGEGEGKNNTLREEVGQGIVRIRSNGKVIRKISVLGVLKKNKVGVVTTWSMACGSAEYFSLQAH